jgi:hypothetical protein
MLQMVKEVLELTIHQSLNLLKSHEMKFLYIIDPSQTTKVQLELSYTLGDSNNFMVNAVLRNETTIYFKFKGEFKINSANS